MALCTGGGGAVRTEWLPDLTLFLLLPAMLVGSCAGCTGGTGGGIKHGRFRRLFRRAVGWSTGEDGLDETRL